MNDPKVVRGSNMIASIKVSGTFYPVFCAKSYAMGEKMESKAEKRMEMKKGAKKMVAKKMAKRMKKK